MKDEVRRIVADPAWLVHRYDPAGDRFHLRRVPRDVRDRATFLTDEYLPADAPVLVLGRRDVAAAMHPIPVAPVHFVFHSAFCCSTLLARAFDRPGAATALKEPVVLNDLVGWRQRDAPPAVWEAVERDALRGLARPFETGEAVVVKPSNVVTAVIPALLDAAPAARAVLMYAPLETFLTSVAKKGMDGRLWVRTLFSGFIRDGIADLGYDAMTLFGQTDLQIAALGWLAQQRMFLRLIASAYGPRLRALRSDVLLDDPASAFGRAAALFGIPAEGGTDAFVRHSKTGERFGAADRSRDYAQATAVHGDEIAKVATWARHVADHNGIALDLPQPL